MTRRIIRIFFLSIILLPAAGIAQKISSIEIDGAKNISTNKYLNWIKLSTGSKLFPGIEDSISCRVTDGLKSEGFYNSEIKTNIDSADTSSAKIIVSVRENSQTKISEISFSCSSKADSVFLNQTFDELQNQILIQANLDYTFSEILNHYENSGFPFSKVKIESIFFFDDSSSGEHFANLFLSVNPGEKSSIDIIEIAGNTKTKDYVITRALGISTGEEYNQELIDLIPDRLNRLKFFENVEQPEFYFNSKNDGVLKISIKEKQTNNFDGIFGYVPASSNNDKGYFTGYININLKNLFGTGRAAAIQWQQKDRSSQEFELSYLEPWIFNYPFNVELSLFQRKQDSTYIQRTYEGQLEFLATQEISASALVNWQSTIPSERINKVFTVFNSNAFTSGVNLKIDTRDDVYSPKRGLYLLNTYEYTKKTINGPEEYITADTETKTTFQRLELDFALYHEIFNDQVVALGVHARELKGNNVEISDLYFLGGTKTLRGYRENQFQGNRILWSNLEYRYLLSQRSFSFVFFDTGYFLRNGDEANSIGEISEFKYGYGFGLNIETSLGILGISFALGKGDSFSEGKIHFGIMNEF
jgi:outer membrane protein insertion porin family